MMFPQTVEVAIVQIKTPNIARVLHINVTKHYFNSTPQLASFDASASLSHTL